MSEIILSFFAVIGITLLAMQICDFFFFRKFHPKLPLIVDIRKIEEKEIIEIFEVITTVRQKTSGKSAISELIILTDSLYDKKSDIAKRYMETFRIEGAFYETGDNSWMDEY